MAEFDAHVATQDQNEEFESALEEIGFTHDNLLSRRVSWFRGKELSACPLIGTHMTKKYVTREEVIYDVRKVRELLVRFNQKGYVHGEVVSKDITIRHDKNTTPALLTEKFTIKTPWPFKNFNAQLQKDDKKWDIHIALPIHYIPTQLAQVLDYEKSGLYDILLNKERNVKIEGISVQVRLPFRVYTMQGISLPSEGLKVHEALVTWFKSIKVPWVEVKMETYIGMHRVNNPEIVPPTVHEIKYVNN